MTVVRKLESVLFRRNPRDRQMMFVQLRLQYYPRRFLTHPCGRPTYKRGDSVTRNETSNEDLQVSLNNEFITKKTSVMTD